MGLSPEIFLEFSERRSDSYFREAANQFFQLVSLYLVILLKNEMHRGIAGRLFSYMIFRALNDNFVLVLL